MNAAGAATASAADVRVALRQGDPTRPVAASLQHLVRLGLDRLPMPGSGATRERWQVLAAVAEFDLSLAKLYEGHTDALAILDELDPCPITPCRRGRTTLRSQPPGASGPPNRLRAAP